MNTRNCPKFKGKLGNYSSKEKNVFDPSFDDAFRTFNIKHSKSIQDIVHFNWQGIEIVTQYGFIVVSSIHIMKLKNH